MKIVNKTNWSTPDLRRVFARVLTRWNQIDDKKVRSKRLRRITVVHSRHGFISGCAYVNSGWMRLRLPKDNVGVAQVAYLFEHELAHCAGYEHKNMGPLNSWKLVGSGRYDYVADLTINKAEAKAPKPKADKQIVRYLAAIEARKRWQSKARRAATAIRKYGASIRRYEKVLASDGRLAALKAKGGRDD